MFRATLTALDNVSEPVEMFTVILPDSVKYTGTEEPARSSEAFESAMTG